MAEVRIYRQEIFEYALAAFDRKVKGEGILNEARNRKEFSTRSEKKRAKSIRAAKRRRGKMG